MKYYLLLCLIAVLALPGCKKTATPTPAPGTTDVKIDTDVFVAGTYTAKNGNEVAAYWKNGVITKLSDSALYGTPTSVAIDGPDVYVSGYYNSDSAIPVYWKNSHEGEVKLPIPDTCISASPNGIAVYNHTAFLSGSIYQTHNYPVYWQGTNPPIQLSKSFQSNAVAIAVDGTGVYTAGFLSFAPGSVSTYWKGNGELHTSKDTLLPSGANAIALNGTDIYTAGITLISGKSVATYWKNGIPVYITDGSANSSCTGIAIKDNVVYTCGEQQTPDGNHIACYWKGKVQNNLSDYTKDTSVTGISVIGNDVYVSGSDYVNNQAVYWKNGNMHILPGSKYTVGIAVVTHPH